MSKYIIAHDLGTSGNKATLFCEDGKLITSVSSSYNTYYQQGNIAEQDPYDWWKAVIDTTKQLLKFVPPSDISGVALSGQMMGCLCVDKKGVPLRRHILYCDQRSKIQEDYIKSNIDIHEFYSMTGHRISSAYSLEKLMWIRDNEPDIFAKTYKMLNAKDYINFKLCGVMATDPSDASGTNAYDIMQKKWSEKILSIASLDISLFPEIKRSIDVIGEVTVSAAQETGLKVGTPVICGGGDGSCAGVGVGSISPGMAYNYLGSSSWIALTVEKPIVDDKLRTMNWAHVVPDMLHPSGTMQTAGAANNWMVEQLCDREKNIASISGDNIYDLIDNAISSSPLGANKLIFLPYMLGERTPRWNENAKGAFVGLTLSHTHSDMLRSVREGITMNLEYILSIFRAHLSIEEITVIGGGVNSRLWRQMMADIFNAKIKVPSYVEEATSMGAAVLAGIGSGIFKDFSVIDRFIDIRDEVVPIQENVERYNKLKPLFDSAYYSLEGLYDQIAKTEI